MDKYKASPFAVIGRRIANPDYAIDSYFFLFGGTIILDISPFSESKTATYLVFGNCAIIITKIEVTGTAMNIPSTPQMVPQTVKVMKTTKGLKLRDLPTILGSIKLATIVCAA